MTKVKKDLWEFAVEHFSNFRMASYLASSLQEKAVAVEIYRWNTEVASAYWEAIAYVEVSLRNLLDKKMTQRHQLLGRSGHWIFDNYHELGRARIATETHSQPFREIAEAMNRVRKNGKPMKPAQIISELSFGFWHQLVSKRQLFLWPELASGFINAPSRDQNYISNLTFEVRELRNRIGHHHRLNQYSIRNGWQFIVKLAGAIDENLVDWITMNSRMQALMQNHPMKSHLLP